MKHLLLLIFFLLGLAPIPYVNEVPTLGNNFTYTGPVGGVGNSGSGNYMTGGNELIAYRGGQFDYQIFIYSIASGSWVLKKTLNYTISGREFGVGIALSPDDEYVAVGRTNPISVEFYKNNNNNWTYLNNINLVTNNGIVRKLLLNGNGNFLVVHEGNIGGFPADGRVYVYNKLSDGSYNATPTIYDNTDPVSWGGEYGLGLDIRRDGKYLAIGSPGGIVSGNETGVVKIYNKFGDTFSSTPTYTINPPTTDLYQAFGYSIASDGAYMVIASASANYPTQASSTNQSVGKIHLYRLVGNTWNYLVSYWCPSIITGSWFGSRLSCSYNCSYIVSCADQQVVDPYGYRGTCYVYKRIKDALTLIHTLAPSNVSTDMYFGDYLASTKNGKGFSIGASGFASGSLSKGYYEMYKY